jgi:hypothetical protein
MYRCPVVGMPTHAWLDQIDPAASDHFVTITCVACQRIHLINPKTGKLAGDPEPGTTE